MKRGLAPASPMKRIDAKILYAFQRLVPLLKNYILRHRFLETTSKDSLIRQIDVIDADLRDAHIRSGGTVPYTPNQVKRQKEWHCKVSPNASDCKKKRTTS